MAISTTLVTFMVRTPPTARSVALYGSWDNFSTPYIMTRDNRLGLEHWTGCHNFKNIICDGDFDGLCVSRDGALKMGGTYWYFYKMDDHLEFHNSSELSSTHCPLLPGQLVNVLHVPFTLNDSATRNSSIESAPPTQFTLDPGSKFTNARPQPKRPRLRRLNTSPTTSELQPIRNQHVQVPLSAVPIVQTSCEATTDLCPPRMCDLPRKPSLDALLGVAAVSRNPAGMRPAFNISTNDTHQGKYHEIINWTPERQRMAQDDETAELVPERGIEKPVQVKRRDFSLFRSTSEEAVPFASFAAHRRKHSQSRSQTTSNCSSNMTDETACPISHGKRGGHPGPLPSLLEIITPECTPDYGPLTGRRIALDALEGRLHEIRSDHERLPTMSSSPPSAYPEGATVDTPLYHNIITHSIEINSRFSSTTVDSDYGLEEQQTSFLDFNDSALSSAVDDLAYDGSTNTPPSFELPVRSIRRPVSSTSTVLLEFSSVEKSLPSLLTAMTCTMVDSSVSSAPATSCAESDITETSLSLCVSNICSSSKGLEHIQHYSLPLDGTETNSSSIVKHQIRQPSGVRNEIARTVHHRHRSSLSHSDGMRQLLDELSYLSELIQN